jgi:hypothetical protein
VEPSILMGESLRSLHQYVLLEPPTLLRTGSCGDHVPLRVRRRGDGDESELTLVIPPEMLAAVAAFFEHVAKRSNA